MAQPIDDPALYATRQSLLLRLKDHDDQDGWREFFEIYWRLIYSVCLKSGLSEVESEDVVQDTMVSLAKEMPRFHYDRSKGSFRAFLLTVVRRRIVDRHRQEARWHRIVSPTPPPESPSDTGLVDSPDPNRPDLDRLWASEWEGHLIKRALDQVREQVTEKQYLIYEMHVLREVPISTVVANLQTSAMSVYLAKHRVGKLLRLELGRLKQEESED